MKHFFHIFAMNTPSSILLQLTVIFLFLSGGADYCENKRLSNPCGITVTDSSLNLAVREATAFLVSYFLIKFHTQMPSSIEILAMVQGANASKRVANETRRQIINYFTENYPAVRRLKFKSCYQGKFYVARAKCNGRVLYAKAYNLQVCIERFIVEYQTKVLC